MSDIRATKNRVILRQDAVEKKSAGGLILDIQTGIERDRGVVVHVGDKVEGIAVDQTVVLSHTGIPVGDNLISVHSDHIVAVIV